MAVLGGLLIFVGLAGVAVGIIALIRPLHRLRIPNRRVAGGVLAAGFVIMLIGGAVTPTDATDKSVPASSANVAAAKPTDGPKPTETPTVTESATARPTPSATTTPQSLEQRIEKSIRDNKNAVNSGANLDNLQIAFDAAGGRLTVSIRPNSPDKDTQFITNGSALAIISGKAIWSTYNQVQRVSVQVFREEKDDHGNLLTEQMAVADYARENGLKYNYGNLKNQPSDDNKQMYCTADFYAVSERVWAAIDDKGCMKARAGGANPTQDQKDFIVALPTVAPKPTATPVPPTAAPEPAGYSFGSGKKLVGSEVAFATYRTRSASANCYWERLTGLGGTLGEIAANDNTNGPAVVTIQSGDVAFNSTRCARWTEDLSPITSNPAAPFGEGMFIVGVDIGPGVWRSDGTGSCYWERVSGFTGSLGSIIANENATGPTIVEIGAGDKGFSSSRCGKWTKQ